VSGSQQEFIEGVQTLLRQGPFSRDTFAQLYKVGSATFNCSPRSHLE
jgi:hypothetical protein